MKMTVLWDVAPCSLVKVYRRFRGVCCLHHQGDESLIALIGLIEAASTSETSVNYQTRRRNIPEDRHLHTRRRENLKSHLVHYHVHKSRPPVPILIRTNSVNTLPHCFLKIHVNILSSTPRPTSSAWSLPFWISNQNFVGIINLPPDVLHAPPTTCDPQNPKTKFLIYRYTPIYTCSIYAWVAVRAFLVKGQERGCS
jgi:hypothetical protein